MSIRLVSLVRGVAVIAVALTSLASVAVAEDTVTQEITSGSFSAVVADATLTSVAYSNTATSSTGTLMLTVDDSRGTGTGWNVTISSGNFIYGGGSLIGEDILASGFQTTGFGTLVVNAGQASPALTAGAGGTLSAAVPVLSAASGAGSGNYTQPINVSLAIPAQSQAGTYVAELEVTITDGPTPWAPGCR
jgi:hypothetical protein